MPLRDPKIPYNAIKGMAEHLTTEYCSLTKKVLKNPPSESVSLLQYFREIRQNADRLYTATIRISQLAATAMECIEPESSNAPLDLPPIEVPDVTSEFIEALETPAKIREISNEPDGEVKEAIEDPESKD